jgi:hypothetical protein
MKKPILTIELLKEELKHGGRKGIQFAYMVEYLRKNYYLLPAIAQAMLSAEEIYNDLVEIHSMKRNRYGKV